MPCLVKWLPCSLSACADLTIGSAALAWSFDGIFQPGTPVALTEGFSFNAAIQHYWTPALRTSVFGGYVQLDFDATATGLFCTGLSGGAAPGPGLIGTSPLVVCNPDFAVWQVGSRTIWSPVANLDIGVEVLYTRVDQSHVGTWNLGTQVSRAAGLYETRDQDTWSGVLRFQRNFWP